MMKKLFTLFAALTLSAGLWAEGSVFTYTATEKLTLNFMKLGTVATHEFKDGNGKVTYNETITTIGEYAFNGCSKLTSITIPASVTTIGKGAFYKSGLTSITIPAGVTEIGKDVFNQCESLASVTLPEGVTTIGEYAFSNCSALQSITIPAGVTTIGQYAFYGAGLTSITIPAGVTTIGGYTFYECTALASVTFLGNACQKGIGNNAFGRVGDPTPALLTLPANWTGTKPNEQGKWYGGKFTLAAPAKTSVITYTAKEKLQETTEMWGEGLHTNAFYAADSTQLTVTHTFDEAEGVGTITLDGEVAIIGDYAFFGAAFTSIELPASINQIGTEAFDGCDYMESIAIPEAVTVISQKAFYDCAILTTVTMGNNVTIIGKSAFRDCDKLTSITWPSALEEISAYAFNGTGFTSVELPQSVKKIGSNAFQDSKLTTFVFPEDLDTIPDDIFNECDALVSVTLPLNVKHIGDVAFGAGPKLTTISLPATVESLGMGAFYNNPFTSITCAALVPPTCGDMCFEEVNKDIPVYVPEGTVELYKAADGWKDFTFIEEFDPTALPTLFGDGVKGNKFMHNGRLIIDANGKRYNAVGF